MKNYLIILGIALVLLVAMPVSAYNTSLTPVINYTAYPFYMQASNLSQFQAICTAAGYCDHDQFGNHFSHQYMGQYGQTDNLLVWSDSDNAYGPFSWDANGRYAYTAVRCWQSCGSGTTVYTSLGYIYRAGYDYVPQISFSGSPTNGTAPVLVYFSAKNLTNTSVKWTWGDGASDSYPVDGSLSSHQYNNPGSYTVSLEYTAANLSKYTITKPDYIKVINQSGLHLIVNVIDSDTHNRINGATIGIKNMSSSSWWNFTASSGGASFQSTDINGTYPLSKGQTVVVAANATGYDSGSLSVTIPYDFYEANVYLTRNSLIARNGTWNLIAEIKSNKYGTPVNSATVKLITGVNGQTYWELVTSDDGLASFMNVTPSATALVDVVCQGYKSASAVVTVVPNSTQRVTIELVGIYDTPVTTPIPTPNSSVLTAQPTAVITDPNGNPITTSEGKAQWGLDRLFDIIPTVAVIVASLILAWLFWRGIDICTNGMASLIMRKMIEGLIKDMFK